MGFIRVNVSIDEEYKKFLEKEGLSPSKLLKQKIEEKMREKGLLDVAVMPPEKKRKPYVMSLMQS